VLSLIAGSVDAIGFLGLDGLFTAHITGNLVILAARLVGGEQAPVAQVLSVPVFILVLGLVRLLAGGLERIGVSPLRPLLLLQFILLAGFLALCLEAGPHLDPNATVPIVAGMLGVSAMALQNALVQVALTGVPTTAVMTTNVTHFMMDLGAVALERDAAAGRRAKRTLPAILGFAVGCGLGAWSEAVVGLRALVLPVGLALLALAIGHPASPAPARRT
jgi:uncharacterized membrane protein YoaK (UPF0700 family)